MSKGDKLVLAGIDYNDKNSLHKNAQEALKKKCCDDGASGREENPSMAIALVVISKLKIMTSMMKLF